MRARLLLASGLVAVVLGAAASSAAGVLPIVGLVQGEGQRTLFSGGYGTCLLNLGFFGRMPAGSRVYNALFGRMTTYAACEDSLILSVRASTPSGYFKWTCAGTGIADPFTCTTVQAGGSFTLRLELTETRLPGDGYSSTEYYAYEGFYEATIP